MPAVVSTVWGGVTGPVRYAIPNPHEESSLLPKYWKDHANLKTIWWLFVLTDLGRSASLDLGSGGDLMRSVVVVFCESLNATGWFVAPAGADSSNVLCSHPKKLSICYKRMVCGPHKADSLRQDIVNRQFHTGRCRHTVYTGRCCYTVYTGRCRHTVYKGRCSHTVYTGLCRQRNKTESS